MWRILILTVSILFLSVQSAQAGKGGGHHGGGHHKGQGHNGFAYRSHWHHRGWGHVYLGPEFTVYLSPLPYREPGYQVVTVYFGDGSSVNNVYVYNHDQIEMPHRYDGRTIVRVVVEN